MSNQVKIFVAIRLIMQHENYKWNKLVHFKCIRVFLATGVSRIWQTRRVHSRRRECGGEWCSENVLEKPS